MVIGPHNNFIDNPDMVVGEWNSVWGHYSHILSQRDLQELLRHYDILTYLLHGNRGYERRQVSTSFQFHQSIPEQQVFQLSYRRIKVISRNFEPKPTAEVVAHLDVTGKEPVADVAKITYRRRLIDTRGLAKKMQPQVDSALKDVKQIMKGVSYGKTD